MDKHPINNRLGLGDKSRIGSQSFRGPEWSASSMDPQIRRNLLLSESARFGVKTMKGIYRSIEQEEMEYHGIKDIDDLNSKRPDVMETVNDKFSQILVLRTKNSKKMLEIKKVLSNNKSVKQQALTEWLGNIDVSEEEDSKVMDVILAKTNELRRKPSNFLIRSRGKERKEIIESINTQIKEMNEVLPIYKPFRKIKASQYLGDADKEIIENMSSAFSQLIESYKNGNSTTKLKEDIKKYGVQLKGLSEAIDICKKANELKSSDNELISLFSKDMNTISEAYCAFRDRHEYEDSSSDLLLQTLQHKWTHLTEELRGNLKQSLEKQRDIIHSVFEEFKDNEHLEYLKSLYEKNRDNSLDFSRYSFDKESIHKLNEYVTKIVDFDIHTLQEAIIHIGNGIRREWEFLPVSDDLNQKRNSIERQMEEVALHLAKNEKPDNSFEQLMQLVKSIKEFDEELKALRR